MRFNLNRRDILLAAAILLGSAGLAIGTHWAVASTVDRLVRKDAERAAHGRGRYLSTNLHGIEHIAAGGRPSAESLTFIEGARTIG